MHEIVKVLAQYLVIVPIITIVVVYFKLENKRRKGFIIYAALASILALILVKLAAALHQDPRPFISDGVTPYFKHSRDNGFPSDHATFSALIAFIVLKYRRNLGFVLLAIAVIIGASRVIAGVHHGQDIVAGIIIAGVATFISYQITKHNSISKSKIEE